MKTALRVGVVAYLLIALVLAVLPLTGYYGALLAAPVAGVYLFKKIILAEEAASPLISRRIFLLSCIIILFGFFFNVFCSVYTTCRQSEFKDAIVGDRDRIQKNINPAAQPAKK